MEGFYLIGVRKSLLNLLCLASVIQIHPTFASEIQKENSIYYIPFESVEIKGTKENRVFVLERIDLSFGDNAADNKRSQKLANCYSEHERATLASDYQDWINFQRTKLSGKYWELNHSTETTYLDWISFHLKPEELAKIEFVPYSDRLNFVANWLKDSSLRSNEYLGRFVGVSAESALLDISELLYVACNKVPSMRRGVAWAQTNEVDYKTVLNKADKWSESLLRKP